MCTLIFQHIVDHFMVHSNTELMRMVNVVFAIIIVLYIIRLGVYIIRGIVGARISRDIEKKLLDDFLGDLLKVSVNYYDSMTNGEVLERLNDIEHIKETLCSTVLNLTLDLVAAVVSGIIIFIKSPVLFVITCVITFGFYRNWIDAGGIGTVSAHITTTEGISGHTMAVEGYALYKSNDASSYLHILRVADGWHCYSRHLNNDFGKYNSYEGYAFQ